jgi:hypothetical protein
MSRMTKPERIQLWLDRLNRHAASQLTVAEFCQCEEISLPSFYQWKRRLTPRIESATNRRKSRPPRQTLGSTTVAHQPSFTELVVNASQTTACVLLPGDITISLGTQPEIASLIVDRLLQHAANLAVNKAASC